MSISLSAKAQFSHLAPFGTVTVPQPHAQSSQHLQRGCHSFAVRVNISPDRSHVGRHRACDLQACMRRPLRAPGRHGLVVCHVEVQGICGEVAKVARSDREARCAPSVLSPDGRASPRRTSALHAGAVSPLLRSCHRPGRPLDPHEESLRCDQAHQHAAFVVAVHRRAACGGSTRATRAQGAALTDARPCACAWPHR